MHWVAHYNDGTQVSQEETSYSSIDRSKMVVFDLWEKNRLILRLDLRDPAKRLIWRKRGQISSNGHQTSVHLAGWITDGNDPEVMCYVFENGEVLVSSGWGQENFAYPVKLMECEK